jgi:hypothetical protein
VREGVTLQINLAPADLPHAGETLVHQLRQWGGQVQEVVFSVESHRSEGRYGSDWERREPLHELLEGICEQHPGARVSTVDYSDETREAIAREFFGGKAVPLKSHTGAPFYSYFHGLVSARFDHVLHLDSDMLFGGGSQTWIAEAKALLAERDDVLFCSPLSGPPTPDGEIPGHVLDRAERWGGIFHGRETGPLLTHRFGDVSTRVFLVDRAQLAALGPLRLRRPGLGGALGRKSASPTSVRKLVRARLRGTPQPASAEDTLSGAMRAARQVRVDYLGREPGMWSLHPVSHSEDFYRELPRVIELVEGGDVPAGQLGDYNINDSLLAGQSAPSDVV